MITDLDILLRSIEPHLHDSAYVFTSHRHLPSTVIADIEAIIQESEGTTIISKMLIADQHRWSYDLLWAKITLTVHSDLAAVGLTAAFAKALADKNLSCNVVAGYYHDHIYVPYDRRDEAMQALSTI
jgi:uncharacterized protein